MTPTPKTLSLIPSTPTSVNQDHIGSQLKNSKEIAWKTLAGGDPSNLGTHNSVAIIQTTDDGAKSLNFGQTTSKELCNTPISGGKGKRTRKYKRRRACRHKHTKRTRSSKRRRGCKCRRSCKCRKTRRRRKSYRKKRK